MSSDIEKKLLSQLLNDDVKAFDRLFHFYSRRLYRFAFSLLKNKEDAEGIVQEVFLRVWDKRAGIDTSKSFKSFLFTISYHLIMDALRLRLKEKAYLSHLEKFFNIEELTSEQEADYNLLKSKVDEVVEELPEKRKQIYKLSREEGLSHKEISEKLNITVKTVENQITLAIKHLKSRLGRELLAVLLFISLFR
jgi:RNA polymerase sigma-70 factor (ECF subfamily)